MSEPLLPWSDRHFLLHRPEMDATHKEFVALVNRLHAADDAELPALFQALLDHTRAHFTNELRLMEESRFAPIREHDGEHRRVLAELERTAGHLAKGHLGYVRDYVAQRLPEWFSLHAATMDSALARHLRLVQEGRVPVAGAPPPGLFVTKG